MEDVLKLTRSIAHCADKATNKNIIDLVSSDEDNNSEESINGIDQDNAVYDVDKHDIVVVVPNSDSEVLYKDGPGLTHAAYIVLIEHQGQNVQEWTSILGHVRIAATTVKDILLAEVVRNDTEVLDGPKELQNYSVRESLITRKLPITMKDDD
ncbi:tRNA-splicing endonuclease subunit Sen2-1 [Eumeta japonica]|uniref:tRNA-intron lyase n=1 Tax=Eumeta variegata TaxID=151549 RepID=A0A4C1TRY7_EUMVA|nr:tRNA-splicing endonuclease subunit Sen2-1 [Eumeta japonica]